MSVLANLLPRPRAAAPSTAERAGGPPVPMGGQVAGILGSLFGLNDPERQMEMMTRSGTLYATITRIATAFSAVRWHMFRTSDGRGRITGPDPRREVPKHAMLDLWNKPNPWMSGQYFREASCQHLKLTGQSFWALSYLAGIPAFMWPIRPDRVMPVPDPDLFIAGWVYSGPNGEQVPLRNEEVIWVRQPHPLNPYTGLGAVEPLMPDIESGRYISDWQRNFFRNSANPGGFVQFPKEVRLSDNEFNKLTARWAEQHQGVRAAHRVAFLEMGATWQSADLSMKDMQFVELRQDSRDIIYEANGVSKSILGVVDDVNRAAMEGTEYVFSKYGTRVDLERYRDVLNTQLAPRFGATGTGVEMDFDDPVPKDWQADSATTTANANGAKALVDAGYNPDDVTDAMSLPKMRHTGVIPAAAQPAKAPVPTYEPAQGDKDGA
jgi:HK97 family phage portal protein